MTTKILGISAAALALIALATSMNSPLVAPAGTSAEEENPVRVAVRAQISAHAPDTQRAGLEAHRKTEEKLLR